VRRPRTRGVSNRSRCTGEAAKAIASRGDRQPPSPANLAVSPMLDSTHHADSTVPAPERSFPCPSVAAKLLLLALDPTAWSRGRRRHRRPPLLSSHGASSTTGKLTLVHVSRHSTARPSPSSPSTSTPTACCAAPAMATWPPSSMSSPTWSSCGQQP
jgi:hypothetical protein